MVMGSSFCICLERPKYFYMATDKAVCFQMNSLCPSFPTGEIMYTVCVSVHSWVLKQVSHGDGHSQGSTGKHLPHQGGLGTLTLICVGCDPRGGGGCAGCTNMYSACACIRHAYVSRTVGCAHLGGSLGGKKLEGQIYCESSVVLVGRSFCWALLPGPNK